MPVWSAGSPQEMRRREDMRTLSGQIQSLTFVDRAPPGSRFTGDDVSVWGRLLESASNSLLDAGFQVRTQPRFQIGNRSGREYEQPIAITPGRGTIDLVYNPLLPLHAALRHPYALKASYVIRSVMAPPYMSMVAGIYDQVSGSPTGMNPEDQSIKTVEFLDNLGAEIIPSRLYQLIETTIPATSDRASTPDLYQFSVLTDADESLPIGARLGASAQPTISQDDITLAVNPTAAQIDARSTQTSSPTAPAHPDLPSGAIAIVNNIAETNTVLNWGDLTDSDTPGYDTFFLLHIPGEGGGYAVSPNHKDSDLSNVGRGIPAPIGDPTPVLIATDRTLAMRMAALDPLVAYLGVYSTPTSGLLAR